VRAQVPIRVFAAALVLQVPLAGHAGGSTKEAREIIDRMSEARKSLSFEGILVYQRGKNLYSMRIIHKADKGRERERLISLSGPARELVRDERQTTCVFPDNRAVMVVKNRFSEIFPAPLPKPIEQIENLYSFSVLGKDRVAGREAWVVRIQPKDPDRYEHKLWIDAASYLLLKSHILDSQGETLEEVLFTRIKLRDFIPDSLLTPKLAGEGYTWYRNEPGGNKADDGSGAKWTVNWLPEGFAMRGYEEQAITPSRPAVDHLFFSDGLATFSVFVEKSAAPAADGVESQTSLGAVNTYTWMTDGYQVTVVGELPAVTVRRVAGSIAGKEIAGKED